MAYRESYDESINRPEQFWRRECEGIEWFVPPQQILSRDATGYPQWFRGGKLNTCHLAVDAHVAGGRGEQVALIHDSPVTDTQTRYTYAELLEQVARFAGALRGLGVDRGDTVLIYMPMIPETVIAMLACARIGAIHSVVFGGFAAHELAVRIDDAGPKVLLTASAGKEVDRVIDYKSIVDDAFEQSRHSPQTCVVLQRAFHEVDLRPPRDRDWREIAAAAVAADCVVLEATDPLYILYTSGTTGRPKGIVRDHGGHAVALKFSMRAIYDIRPGEVFWAASDLGWVVGHSYIVYAPLIHGCTTVLYEGKPIRTPDAGGFWRVAAEHDVRVMFTAPTAIRAIRKEDPEGRMTERYDLSRLRQLFLAGERCDASTLAWSERLLRIPIIDHWWQTESGWPMVSNPTGIELMPTKPGSASVPVCGYDLKVLDAEGRPLPPGREGPICVRLPLPPGCLTTLWNNPERFQQAYFKTFPGYYLSGDGGYQDEDGYVFITGRLDDILNVAGHRLSTATMEEVVAANLAVAECAVIGMPDALKGEVPIAFLVLKDDADMDIESLKQEVVASVRHEIGPIGSLRRVFVVGRLPKTRSGKILRRTLRSVVAGEQYQIPATIEDPAVIDEIVGVLDSELGPIRDG